MRAIRFPLGSIPGESLPAMASHAKQGYPAAKVRVMETAEPLRMCRRPRASRRALGAWLGIFALLVHGFMPIGQAVPVGGAGDPAFLVICTGYGARILPTEPGKSAPEDRPWSCPVCQASALGDTLAAPGSKAVQPPASVYVSAVPDAGWQCPGSALSSPWQARAPPVV